MSITEIIKKEFENWGKTERIIFPAVIFLIVFISVLMKGGALSVFAAVCGVSYTILAGKGKISCYVIGMAGSVCYAYLSFKSAIYGNFILYGIYYFTMDIIGIIKWKNNLLQETREVIKTRLGLTKNLIYITAGILISLIVGIILKKSGDISPFADSFASIFSIYGMYLTVNRYAQQWDVWFFVNVLSLIIWIKAYINGAGHIPLILMWGIYVLVAVYFKYTWEKELRETA